MEGPGEREQGVLWGLLAWERGGGDWDGDKANDSQAAAVRILHRRYWGQEKVGRKSPVLCECTLCKMGVKNQVQS